MYAHALRRYCGRAATRRTRCCCCCCSASARVTGWRRGGRPSALIETNAKQTKSPPRVFGAASCDGRRDVIVLLLFRRARPPARRNVTRPDLPLGTGSSPPPPPPPPAKDVRTLAPPRTWSRRVQTTRVVLCRAFSWPFLKVRTAAYTGRRWRSGQGTRVRTPSAVDFELPADRPADAREYFGVFLFNLPIFYTSGESADGGPSVARQPVRAVYSTRSAVCRLCL